MASGRMHEFINGSALVILGTSYIVLRANNLVSIPFSTITIFTLAYLVGAFLITPDLDVQSKWVRPKRWWGVLGYLWWPYGMFSRHRGISHTWIIGPLTRLVYLFFIVFLLLLPLLLFIGTKQFYYDAPSMQGWGRIALIAGSGYYLSQWMHLLGDQVPLGYDRIILNRIRKRRAKQKKNKTKKSKLHKEHNHHHE